MTSKTISGSLTHGVTLTAAYNYNPLYVSGTINAATGDGVRGDNTQSWTVGNTGTITAAAGNGVKLLDGGSVTNGASGATNALISGFNDGIYIYTPGPAATVTNFGTVVAGATGVGVLLKGGGNVTGIVTNGAPGATGALITSGYFGIELENQPGTVVNFGTIVGAAPLGAVRLDGGTVVNGSLGAPGAVINGGTGVAVYNAGGTFGLTNYGMINVTGNFAAVRNTTSIGAVANFGTVSSAHGTGIQLGASLGTSTVTNAAGGLISGTQGIYITAGNGTVTNAGTITGSGGTAVAFATGANRLIIDPGAVFNGIVNGGGGTSTNVIELAPGSATGTISGIGASFVNFGTLAVDPGATWQIIGSAPQTVSNLGTITSAGNLALYLAAGGTVTNGTSLSNAAMIVGTRSGIGFKGTVGATVTNFATIKGIGSGGLGDGIGIRLSAGAVAINNSGLIQGYGNGIAFNSPSTGIITNSGTIASTGPLGIGINFGSAANTLTTSGTIIGSGGTAVRFGGANDRLILGPGAAFVGKVDGGAGSNTLELAAGSGTGTLTGLGTSFTNFGVLTVDAGASWKFTGNTIGSGVTLTDSGSLFNAGSIGTEATLTAAGYLANLAGGVIAAAATAIKATGSAAAIANYGLVQGTSGPGIYLAAGGSITNGAGGVITSAATPIKATGSPAAIVNLGMVQGTSGSGIYLGAGGSVSNGSGSATTALIAGYDGIIVRNAAGTVTNYATITGSGIFDSGVALDGGGSLSNRGTIAATGSQSYAVFLVGGSLTNGSSGATGGVITGSGKDGVLLRGAGSIANFGTIAATNTAVGVGVSFSGGGDTLVNAGTISGASGTAVVFSGTGSNLLVLEGGYQFVGGVVGSGSASNTVQLAGSVGAALTVGYNGIGLTNFQDLLFGNGGNDTLKVSNTSGTLPVTISGFTLTSDIVDLTAIGTNGTITQFDTTTDQLTIAGSGGTLTLQLDASDATSFTTVSDGAAGTDLAPICFCRGTLILTEKGEVPVEKLAVGDRVKTLSGACKPIVWIGLGRGLVTRANRLARPVIVRRGALADNVPRRDLYLTHGHALFFDGVLIPVENLVNHRSILWDDTARVVEYYHIELEDHDVVFADGAPAESYYAAGNRALFQNAREGSEAGAAMPTCAPVLNAGETVETAWARLFERAGGQIERATTDEPDLHLVIAGERLDPTALADGVYTFALAAPPAGTLLLSSRSAVPSLLGLNRHEHRRLGVAIRQIILYRPGVMTCFDHDAPLFREGGCHLPEDGYSWTDGKFALPARLFAHLNGAFTLAVQTKRHCMRYPIAAQVAAAA